MDEFGRNTGLQRQAVHNLHRVESKLMDRQVHIHQDLVIFDNFFRVLELQQYLGLQSFGLCFTMQVSFDGLKPQNANFSCVFSESSFKKVILLLHRECRPPG
eukprot:TRINITY_DN3106_c0_g1_i1.p2 TRINITY_DN3106_c0_g1~~TRINITY_DN3106_c0_g1_i1.p2  ORF type:complete len:102 (-),score=6.96 TRINITY_DN3106_c0_g1_i1:11-316(-)